MFNYYMWLASRSMKRNVVVTILMVLTIGCGVSLAMSAWTLVHLMTRDPIPEKSEKLYFPTMDTWGPTIGAGQADRDEPPSLFDYATANSLLAEHRATYQAAIYWVKPTIVPSESGKYPFNSFGFAVSNEFFQMLDVPFHYGNKWSASDDMSRAQVVAISQRLNNLMFNGSDSTGKSLNVNGKNFQIIGVLRDWNPQPTYYHIPAFGGFMLQPTDIFMPFTTAVSLEIPVSGSRSCLSSPEKSGFAGLLLSNCTWISYIVQLDNASAAESYKEYLTSSSRHRFSWNPNVRLRNLTEWLNYQEVVPSGISIFRHVGVGILIVCLVNTVGLLLAKFLRRSNEIGIRRALGATRAAIYAQFLIEGSIIGAAGGFVGLIFTWLAMNWLRGKFPVGWESLTALDWKTLAATLLVAIVATLISSIYPAWRAAGVEPSLQIKAS